MKKLMLILFFLPLIGFGQFLPMKMNIIDGRDIKQCDDGGFIIVGDIRIRNQNGSSVLQGSLLKTDRNRNLIWKKPIAKPSGLGSLNSVQVSDDGGFIVAGKGWGIGVSHLLKTDGNGNILWKKEFKGGGKSDIKSLQILDDGGFIVAGMSDADAYLFKTDRNGNLLWEKKFEFGEFSYNEYTEVANSVQICDDGGFIVTGNVVRNDRRYIRASFLFKTDRNGNLIWKRKFPSSIANSVQICNDGGFIVAGTAFKILEADVCFEILLIQLNSLPNNIFGFYTTALITSKNILSEYSKIDFINFNTNFFSTEIKVLFDEMFIYSRIRTEDL